MREIVWVCGTSAVGKESFIQRACDDTALQEMFGWAGMVVRSSLPSIEYIGQFDDDPVVDKREQIIADAVGDTLTDVLLVKWQFVDSEVERVQRLKEACPTARHRLIWLMAEHEAIRPRLVTKSWWQSGDDELEFIANEQDRLLATALKDPAFDEVIKVTSGNDFQYKIVN